MSSVALLPKEFSCSEERGRVFEFPSDNVGPLIKKDRKVSVTLNPLRKGGVHDGFTSGSDCHRFFESRCTVFGDPGDFRGEALNVIFLCC